MKIKPFKLERYYTINEFSAKYSLCNSDCEAMAIKDVLSFEDGAVDAFHELWLGYTETAGHPALRNDIASTYSVITPNKLLVCSGAQEPIYLFCQAYLQAGDDVIVQTPCYQSVHSIPESLGCTVLNWSVKYVDETPLFDIEELKQMVTDKTKVVFLNTPHNPTGVHFTQAEQLALVEIARAHDVILFCDEVYKDLEYNTESTLPAFADVYEHGVSIGVMSKAYGLPGLRIGWIASQDESILEKVAILKEYTTICNSAPSEFLAGVALRNREQILSRNLDIIHNNLAQYDLFFLKYAELFSWYRPHAGPITLVKMKFDDDDMAFAKKALTEQSVMILPGSLFDYKGVFRIGFGRKNLPAALAQFEMFLNKL